MPARKWLARQGFRIVGPPPPKDAPKVELLKFVRRCYTGMLRFYVPVLVLLVFAELPTWAWIVIAAGAGLWLQGFVSISLRIRRQPKDPVDWEPRRCRGSIKATLSTAPLSAQRTSVPYCPAFLG